MSASIRSYFDVLEAALPIIDRWQLPSKAICSVGELAKLNSGMFYGLSQVGKALTIYAGEVDVARSVGQELRIATRGLAAPVIPYEPPVAAGSCVYFRYGSFVDSRIVDPEGRAVEDDRTEPCPPQWVTSSPFPCDGHASVFDCNIWPAQLRRSYFPAGLLTARGKGYVQLVVDALRPSQLAILKVGFYCGELSWDGLDGKTRLRSEIVWLRRLHRLGVSVPRVLATYHNARASFAVLDRPSDITLAELLAAPCEACPDLETQVAVALSIATAVQMLHSGNTVWGDLKPANILIDEAKGGPLAVWLLDFEGAVQDGKKRGYPWGSPGYIPPEGLDGNSSMTKATDVYALGVVLAQLAFWTISPTQAIARVRTDSVHPLACVANDCLATEPNIRPTIHEVVGRLHSISVAVQRQVGRHMTGLGK